MTNIETAPVTTPVVDVPPSEDVVNAILKWPVEQKRMLADLLTQSVEVGFESLPEARERERDLIRSRIEAYERGEMKAEDWRVSLAKVRAKLREEFPQ